MKEVKKDEKKEKKKEQRNYTLRRNTQEGSLLPGMDRSSINAEMK